MKNKFYFSAGLALIFLSACNPNPHKTITVKDPNTGEKTEVEVTKGLMTNDVTIENKDKGTNLTITEGKMPEGMPSYIKPYPNGKEFKAMHAKNTKEVEASKKGEALMFSFETNDEPQKIVDFYNKILSENGYKANANMTIGKMAMSNYVNEKDKMAAQIMATNEDGKKTTAQIIVEKGQQQQTTFKIILKGIKKAIHEILSAHRVKMRIAQSYGEFDVRSFNAKSHRSLVNR